MRKPSRRQLAACSASAARPLLIAAAARGDAPQALDPAGIPQLAGMLPVSPRGVGPPIDNRQTGVGVAAAPTFERVVGRTKGLLSEPIPARTDESYSDLLRTRSRSRRQAVIG